MLLNPRYGSLVSQHLTVHFLFRLIARHVKTSARVEAQYDEATLQFQYV